LKWDAFIGRKGGMKNTLAPLKLAAQPNEALISDLNQKPKLDAIPVAKHDEEKPQSPIEQQEKPKSPVVEQQQPEEKPQSPIEQQQQEEDKPESPIQQQEEEKPQSPIEQQQQEEDKPQSPVEQPTERPQSPTVEQQRKSEDQQRVQNQAKELLKGKPIIFVGGGPGIKTN